MLQLLCEYQSRSRLIDAFIFIMQCSWIRKTTSDTHTHTHTHADRLSSKTVWTWAYNCRTGNARRLKLTEQKTGCSSGTKWQPANTPKSDSISDKLFNSARQTMKRWSKQSLRYGTHSHSTLWGCYNAAKQYAYIFSKKCDRCWNLKGYSRWKNCALLIITQSLFVTEKRHYSDNWNYDRNYLQLQA